MRVRVAACLVWMVCASVLAGCDSIPSIRSSSPEKSFTFAIERVAATPFDRALIDQAEAAYPPRDSVVQAAARFATPTPIPAERYWYVSDGRDGRLPYALTGDAVAYYVAQIEIYRKNPSVTPLDRVSLNYRASVSHHASTVILDDKRGGVAFENVHVVEMKLSWASSGCEEECGWGFDQRRTVVFDQNGTLLRIFHDGTPGVMVV